MSLRCMSAIATLGVSGAIDDASSSCLARDVAHSPARVLLQTAQVRSVLSNKLLEDCSKLWRRCGGIGWNGPTCCAAGSRCDRKHAWYSQCVPADMSLSDCMQPWEQCGGKESGGVPWSRATCCTPGFTCVRSDSWYSQCRPASSLNPTPTTSSTNTEDDVPTAQPTQIVTRPPTGFPTQSPTDATTLAPTDVNTPSPTEQPTLAPSPRPTSVPTHVPTQSPTLAPSLDTDAPTLAPSQRPTLATTNGPSLSTSAYLGYVTMWSTQSALIGAQCEYANSPVNSVDDPVLTPYMRSGFHCAIGDSNPAFGKGEHCGKCYKLTSLGDDGTSGTPGKKGSAIVAVTDGGAGGDAHFDCNLAGFQAITGASTGIFDIEIQEVPCDEVVNNPVVINWADQNAYYCKMMFEHIGGWGQLEAVTVCLDGDNCKEMQQFSGATWTGCPQGVGTSMLFKLTQKSPTGGLSQIACECAGSWPWPTGQRCTCPSNFAA